MKHRRFYLFTLAAPTTARPDGKDKTDGFSIGIEERWLRLALYAATRTAVAGAVLLWFLAISQLAVNSGFNLLNREIAGSFARGVIH